MPAFAIAPSAFTPAAPSALRPPPARPAGPARRAPRAAPRALHLPHTPPPALLAAVNFRNLLPQPRLLPAPAAQHAPAPAPALPPTSFVTAAVKAVGPAVVRIDTERSVSGRVAVPPGMEGLFDDPGLKKFFADEFGAQMVNPTRRTERTLGSGFIVSADGVIVTNAHVVKGVDKLTITLTDGRTFKGVLSGTDDLLDLAVVKIDPNRPTSGPTARGGDGVSEERESDVGAARGVPRMNFGGLAAKPKHPLPVAKLGSSAALSVGDWGEAEHAPLADAGRRVRGACTDSTFLLPPPLSLLQQLRSATRTASTTR